MYRQAGGYQPYFSQVNHDEVPRQIYGGAPNPPSIYIDPSDPRHPQNLTRDPSVFYQPHPQPQLDAVYPANAQYQPMAPSTSLTYASVHAGQQSPPPLDPAFSADPRANPTNPYAHYTAYRMNSREDIVPVGPSHDSLYDPYQRHDTSYHSRNPRVIPSNSRKHRRDSIYGPPLVHSSNSRSPSDTSHHSRSSYTAPSVHDHRASAVSVESVHLPYTAPETHAPVLPMPLPVIESSSGMSKLHKKHRSKGHHAHPTYSSTSVYAPSVVASSFSSSSSSFVHVNTPGGKSSTSLASGKSHAISSLYVANPSSDSGQYALFKPPPGSPHSLDSSRSSSSAHEEPITPPHMSTDTMHSGFSAKPKSLKHSHSPNDTSYSLDAEKIKEIINVSASDDLPPAYSPLPTQNETITAASAHISESKADVSIIMSPDGITIGSSHAAVPGPSRERSPPKELDETGAAAVPEQHVSTRRQSPPHDTMSSQGSSAQEPTSSASSHAPASTQAPQEIKKTRSRKPSIATPPKDLDKIDELDETDPLGFAWHHHGPYEAIVKAVQGSGLQYSNDTHESRGPKIFGTNSDASFPEGRKSRRKPPPLDPSITSFKVKPGEIFPPLLPPQQLPLPLGIVPTPMSPQAPMSPLQKQTFTNAHLQPVGKYEPVPPPFSPTPSQMERATNPEYRMSMMSQVTNAEPPRLTRAHMHSHSHSASQNHSNSSSSGSSPPSSSVHTSSSRSIPRVPLPQLPSDLQVPIHRPQPLPVQPLQLAQPDQPNLSRSNTTPNPRTVPLPAQPVQYQKSASAPYLLSADPPPTPDIQLPPPSVRTRSNAPPSINSQFSSRQPQPHYLPRKLVMPTPLQPMQPLPQPQSSSSVPMSAPSYTGRGENSHSGLKRGVTVGATPKAQDIPMAAGRNLLKKHKDAKAQDKDLERSLEELERRERDEKERSRRKARSASVSVPPGKTPNATVYASKVVVPVIEPTKSSANGGGSGWGFGLFSSGDKEKAKEKEREKEKDRKKLSKKR